MSFWKRKHHSTRKQVVAKDWEFGEKGLLVRGHNGTFWDDEIFHILIGYITVHLCTYQTVYLKRVNYAVCKLYLNKPNTNNIDIYNIHLKCAYMH